MTIFTVDVSSHDGPVDWRAVRSAGVAAACIKATEGGGAAYRYTNPLYSWQARDAADAEMPLVGAYHCLAAGDVDAQRRYFLNAAGAAAWFMLDVEPFDELRSRGLAPGFGDVEGFCSSWWNTSHLPLALYLPHWVWEEMGKPALTQLAGSVVLISSNYPHQNLAPYQDLWASAGSAGWAPYGGLTPDLWQYASTALVPGIRGGREGCDVNAYRGDVAHLTDLLTGTFPPGPIPTTSTEAIVNQLPLLTQGATGQHVKDAQALLNVHGAQLTTDGAFGPHTDAAVRSFQASRNVPNSVVNGHGDGQVGAHTWAALLDVA